MGFEWTVAPIFDTAVVVIDDFFMYVDSTSAPVDDLVRRLEDKSEGETDFGTIEAVDVMIAVEETLTVIAEVTVADAILE